jgi:hypothetical protein
VRSCRSDLTAVLIIHYSFPHWRGHPIRHIILSDEPLARASDTAAYRPASIQRDGVVRYVQRLGRQPLTEAGLCLGIIYEILSTDLILHGSPNTYCASVKETRPFSLVIRRQEFEKIQGFSRQAT